MHAMSSRSDFFACSCTVNNDKPAVCYTESLLLRVSEVRLSSFLIPTIMSVSKSLNTSLLEVEISCKTEHVFCCDLDDLTLQIFFDAWWASRNVCLKRPITWINSRHLPSWGFNSHCGIEEFSSPCIICVMCHEVLRQQS